MPLDEGNRSSHGTLDEAVGGARDGLSGGSLDGWSVGDGNFVKADNREYGYRFGYITTPHGVVGFYDQGSQPGVRKTAPHTSLDFCLAGRTHRISWPRTFSDRFLKTLAKRFAAITVADTSDAELGPGRRQ